MQDISSGDILKGKRLVVDHGIENLLVMDGDIIEADSELEFYAHFVVSRVNVTEGRPHGIKYSLTLHDKNGERLLGFDNAHPIEDKKRGKFSVHRKLTKWDHKHKLKDAAVVAPYDYETAAKLMSDFWDAVDEAIILESQ